MTTAVVVERMIWTGNLALDAELSLLGEDELGYLGEYLRFVRGLGKKFDDGCSWADLPLTPEEEAQLEQWRKDFEKGEYLTLDEFRESRKCGQ